MMETNENNDTVQVESQYRRIRIPKQDFQVKKAATRQSIDSSITSELRNVFEEFAGNGNTVNPHDIKNALRFVDFHREHPDIYKVLEDLCLNFDINGKPVRFDYFINFLNDRLGDNTSRTGVNKLFSVLADPKVNEITPETLHKMIEEIGDSLSVEDVKYMLEVISHPSNDINITSDELYYIMTKKPSDVDLITPVTKSTKH